MKVAILLRSSFYVIICFLLFSCEGFKYISIENKSKANITITAYPGVSTLELVKHHKTYKSKTDTLLLLPPDSTLLFPTYFGGLYFYNEKIKQEEIKLNYLKIVSGTDTIVANSKSEIFHLLKRDRNIGKIIVR